MSQYELPQNSSRSLDDTLSVSDVVGCHATSSSDISSSNPSSDSPSSARFSYDHPPNNLNVQQSLLVLIHLHFLGERLKSSLKWIHHSLRRPLHCFMEDLLKYFQKVGYVSPRFFESVHLATKVFFQRNTFHVNPKDLPQLSSAASFFGAEPKSIFLHIQWTFKAGEFLNYSPSISGLELHLRYHNDLEFLNKSSLYFPRLKQLHVCVHGSIYVAFIELLKDNATLTSIDLNSNCPKDEGARALAEALKVNTSVTSINLRGNYIGDEGAKALAELLKVNTSVTSINLYENCIEFEGARALADALKINNTVTSINLWMNYIKTTGARALAEALKINNTVTSINLCENCIGAEGAKALADALKVNSTFRSIDLGKNSIGPEGARALADALKVNTSVKSIDLQWNCIGDVGARALADALKFNDTVTNVDLFANSIGDDAVRALAEVLKANEKIKISGVSQLNL
ncbi:hypothetical protein GEMRC1_009730 [Eukaryota sp. GEM-RC1]